MSDNHNINVTDFDVEINNDNLSEESKIIVSSATAKLKATNNPRVQVYDPRIMGTSKNKKSKQKWSTGSVELALKGINQGYELKESPFLKYVKEVNLRKARLPFQYTDDELWAIDTCKNDKLFFGNNFISLKQEDVGWQRITLRDYQEKTLTNYELHQWNLLMFPRQSGKTTTTVVEIVHFCTFNVDKDCVVIAQSDLVVSEILKKIKEALSSLPFYMQPGVVSFTKDGFILDNGCRLKIGIASESVVQGFSLDLLFIDEFAYIPASRVDKFWNNIYPTLVNNPKSRCIIASTPNGRNKFYELWTGAINKTNKFVTSRIFWWEVPRRPLPGETKEQALERFKSDSIANMGLEGWEMGFECSFDTQLKSIFAVLRQKALRQNQETFKEDWSEDYHITGNEIGISWLNPEKFEYDLTTDYFFLNIDISEGLGLDYSVIKIRKAYWDIELKKLKYRTVGVYRNNTVSVQDLAYITLSLSQEFNNDRIRILVEINQFGGEYFLAVDNLITNEEQFQNISDSIFGRYYRKSKNDFDRGIRYDKGNKKTAVRALKGLVESDIIEEVHFQSIEEYLNFGKQPNDTYSAQYGNDDLVMVDVTLAHFISQNSAYSTEFLDTAITDLRNSVGDFSEEYLKQLAEEQKRLNSVHVVNGMTLRNYSRETGNVYNNVVNRERKRLDKLQKELNSDEHYFDEKRGRNRQSNSNSRHRQR